MSSINKVKSISVDNIQFQIGNNEYINLTKMCKANGSRLDNYFSNKGTKEYIQALEAKLNIPKSQLIIKRVGGTPTEQGTYAHPLIAIHLGQWISPEFAIAASNLVHQYLTADVSLATNILQRATTPELTSEQSRAIGEVLITKSSDKDLDWIAARAQTKASNKTLNAELAQCPNTSKAVYSLSQNAIVENLTGSSITQLKKKNGLSKSATVREAMDTDELITLAFTEMLAAKRVSKDKPSGDKKCAAVCGTTAKAVKSFSDITTGNIEE